MRDLAQATAVLLGLNWRVFQGALLAEDEATHVDMLLALMDPPHEARVLDLGCGVGEVARLMQRTRPDLEFVLINQDANQLSHVAPGAQMLCADYHAVPLPDGDADGAMFCYSLCHANVPLALHEAARLVRSGGFLFVYDYERLTGSNELMRARLDAQALPHQLIQSIAKNTGWEIEWWQRPVADDTRFRYIWGDDTDYNRIFDQLRICAWKARRV